MSDKKISELTAATTTNAADVLVVVQAGETKKLPISVLANTMPSAIGVREAAETPVSGALSLTKQYSTVTVLNGGLANVNYTLAAGAHGDEKIINSSIGAAFNAVVTVTGGAGFTTLTFSTTGQTATLRNISGSWHIMSLFGAVNA